MLEIGRILELAKRAETIGFDCVWMTDDILVPQSMSILHCDHMLEPLALLTAFKGVTQTRLTLARCWTQTEQE
jgi:alkanesulfonate monooxygenase SsuD/methylene tetrahydromethanopterin reductase-like flavin-dependent oxidoreductase (luciferase family)